MYNKKYFKSSELNSDFAQIAQTVLDLYHPKTVIEFGCGAGHLAKALASLGVKVTALDGYSEPDFSDYPIDFIKIDLNDIALVNNYVKNQVQKYDLAICLEVAEHLNPQTSEHLIRWLTECSSTVVYSAAVPGQGGTGHINCQTREFWHNLFVKRGFKLMDTVRANLRQHTEVAPWYVFNTLDYVYKGEKRSLLNDDELITRLLASETAIASSFYKQMDLITYLKYKLELKPVKAVLRLRNLAKRMLGKPSL
jgi:SAM-dependent methyltransferase